MRLFLSIFLISSISGELDANTVLSFVAKYDELSERHQHCQENLNECQRVNNLETLIAGELERKISTLRYYCYVL